VTDTSERRRIWEERWQRRDAGEFGWYLSEPPPQLVELLRTHRLPEGGALDIACGNGVAARYLARSFAPSVGFDIALAAVSRPATATAASAQEEAGAHASFLVADATASFPFREGSFALVFDRGGLQNLPDGSWPHYFAEVRRVLVPGGVLQLLSSRPAATGAPRRGLRARVGAMIGRGPGAGEPPGHAKLRRAANDRLWPFAASGLRPECQVGTEAPPRRRLVIVGDRNQHQNRRQRSHQPSKNGYRHQLRLR